MCGQPGRVPVSFVLPHVSDWDREINGDGSSRSQLDAPFEEPRGFVPGDNVIGSGWDPRERETSVLTRAGVPSALNHQNRGTHVGMKVTVDLHDPSLVEFYGSRLSSGVVAEVELLGPGKRKYIMENRIGIGE